MAKGQAEDCNESGNKTGTRHGARFVVYSEH